MSDLICGCSGEVKVSEGSRMEYDENHFPIYIPHFSVHCRECVLMSKWYDTAEEAIAAWKLATRADLYDKAIAERDEAIKGRDYLQGKITQMAEMMTREAK